MKFKKYFFLISILCSISIYYVYANNKNVYIKIGFSPNGTAQNIVIDAIDKAKYTIDIAAYTFTSKPISLALIEAKNRGVIIRIIADNKANKNKYTAIHYLVHRNILVRLNSNYLIMHNKFIIIDGNAVQTGSFNYTKNAMSRNAENVIYIKNNLYVSKKYILEFNRLWNESKELLHKF